jgi:hypothetical protein
MIQGDLEGAGGMQGKAEDTRLPLGVARLSRMAFDGVDLNPVWHDLLRRFVYEPKDAAALMDLSVVEQIFGNRELGIAHQARALEIQRVYPSRCATPSPSLRVLAFAAPGDVGANAPLEFLLEGSDIELVTMYLLSGQPVEPVPEHDIAIVAIAESAQHRPQLAALGELKQSCQRPILNPPERVLNLARERLHGLLGDVPGIAMPATVRVSRADLAALANEPSILGKLLPEGAFPLIARPTDSHAGFGLAKLDTAQAIGRYLAGRPEDDFALSCFVDYRGADGLYRKYRIAFVDGRAYAVHMAIADEWAIWYLNAGMKDDAAKRAEEAHFMADFDADFGRRHQAALAAIQERVGLDYFAIDCAETAESKLLLFEADVAMIVHDMDDPAIYPYKRPQIRKLFAAFQGMLRGRV